MSDPIPFVPTDPPPKCVVAPTYAEFRDWRREHYPEVSPLDFIVALTDRPHGAQAIRGRMIDPDQVLWLHGADGFPWAGAVRKELEVQAAYYRART